MAPTGTFTFTVSWGCSWGMAEAELWTDEDFAPSSASVMGTNVDASGGTAAPASWRRVSELWPDETLPPVCGTALNSVVRQGLALGDCWLLGPLAALAARQPGRIHEMFAGCTSDVVA